MPRPVQAPLAVWLVWRRPELRVPFVALFVLHALAVLATGLGEEWIASFAESATLAYAPFSVGPAAAFGLWWVLIGIPIAAVMVWRGRAGTASVAGLVAAPFLLPQYLLMGVIAMPALLRLQEPLHDARRAA